MVRVNRVPTYFQAQIVGHKLDGTTVAFYRVELSTGLFCTVTSHNNTIVGQAMARDLCALGYDFAKKVGIEEVCDIMMRMKVPLRWQFTIRESANHEGVYYPDIRYCGLIKLAGI